MSKIKVIQYRKSFKNYYGIEFSNAYDIHHIDLNRENNSMKNLMILPKKLHQQYHYYLNATLHLRKDGKATERTIDFKIQNHMMTVNSYEMTFINSLMGVLTECSKWMDFKSYLDGTMPNIHGIELEK